MIGRAPGGQWGPPCDRPPTVHAVWRFDRPEPEPLLLCSLHADELAGHERLSHVGPLYVASVQDDAADYGAVTRSS